MHLDQHGLKNCSTVARVSNAELIVIFGNFIRINNFVDLEFGLPMTFFSLSRRILIMFNKNEQRSRMKSKFRGWRTRVAQANVYIRCISRKFRPLNSSILTAINFASVANQQIRDLSHYEPRQWNCPSFQLAPRPNRPEQVQQLPSVKNERKSARPRSVTSIVPWLHRWIARKTHFPGSLLPR